MPARGLKAAGGAVNALPRAAPAEEPAKAAAPRWADGAEGVVALRLSLLEELLDIIFKWLK